jgi:ABC-type phosphate transport system ATPase subunit
MDTEMSKKKNTQKTLDKIFEGENPSPSQDVPVPPQSKKTGEILIEQGYITNEQLNYALLKQKELQEPVGKILIDNNFVNEKVLENVLGKNVYIRDKDFKKFYSLANRKNTIIIGKSRVGKTSLLQQYNKGKDILYFPEPPTPNTLLNSITKDEKIQKLKIDEKIDYILKQNETYTIAIDSLENMTTSLANVLIRLASENKVKLLGAGHSLKKKYSKLWMHTDTMHLKPLNYSESENFIEALGYKNDTKIFTTENTEAIIRASDGLPGKLILLCEEAKTGKVPEIQRKELDLAPLMILIIAIGFTARAIGFGLTSMNVYIIGGIAGGLGIVTFYLFRGYQEGWWGSLTSKNPSQRKNNNFNKFGGML